jgi:putative endonuclease
VPLPFCVYVLFSEFDGLLYTGFTSDLERRLKQHNDGFSKSTAPRRPLKLVFCEYYLFEIDARNREKYLKTTMGKRAIKFMLAHSLLVLGYKLKK